MSKPQGKPLVETLGGLLPPQVSRRLRINPEWKKLKDGTYLTPLCCVPGQYQTINVGPKPKTKSCKRRRRKTKLERLGELVRNLRKRTEREGWATKAYSPRIAMTEAEYHLFLKLVK